jgi:hypothetical protein
MHLLTVCGPVVKLGNEIFTKLNMNQVDRV